MNFLLLTFELLLPRAIAVPTIEHTVTTNGQCTAEVTPDRASVNFTIEKIEKDVKLAIEKATAAHEKLRAELKKSKVKDLELSTSEYTVYEKKDFQKNKSVSLGFAARLGLKASTSEVGDVSKLIAIGANENITETGEFVSYLSDEKERFEKNKCLETATLRSRDKAEALAKVLGSKLGKPVAIVEGGATQPAPLMRTMMMADASRKMMDAGPTIEGRKQTITQNVDVTFSIDP